jgi:hypothetical protein
LHSKTTQIALEANKKNKPGIKGYFYIFPIVFFAIIIEADERFGICTNIKIIKN